MERMHWFVEKVALGSELLAVTIIFAAITFGTVRFIYHLGRKVGDAYKQYKVHLGKALLLSLEFMVAADIVRTVAIEQTMRSVLMLALLVVIRTFLSWSLTVEIEGHLPWKQKEAA